LRFDVMFSGKRYRIPANEFAIPRMEPGKQRPIQSMEEARDWERLFIGEIKAGRDLRWSRTRTVQAGSDLRDAPAFLDAHLERCVKPAGLRSIAAVRSRVGVLKEHLGQLPLPALEDPDQINLGATGVEYVVAMGNNAVLARHAERYLAPLRAVVATTHDPATSYGEAAYQAGTWPAARGTLIKAEVVSHHRREPRDNPRFVITNLRQTPEWTYTHVYCARSDSENRLKELKDAPAFGRTSCTRFWANQLRITLTAATFVVCQELQLRAERTALRGAHVPRLRQALITIGVQVVRSVRRIVLHFPRSHPNAATWAHISPARSAPCFA
jgi:hypothetical protein